MFDCKIDHSPITMSSESTVNPMFCQSERWMEKFTVTVPPADNDPEDPAVITHLSCSKDADVPLTSEYCPEDDVMPA